jgi:hypothetical protein
MKKLLTALLILFPAVLMACESCGMGQGAACMHGGMAAGGLAALRTPIYLLMLGFGYWILRVGEKETNKNLKITGRTIGIVVLAASVAALLCPILFCGHGRGGYRHGEGDGKPSACPFMGRSTVAPEAPAQPEKK